MKMLLMFSTTLTMSIASYGMCYLNKDDYIGKGSSNHDFVSRARAVLAKEGNVYEKEPVSVDAPLSPNLVLNNYWRSLADKPQEERDNALKKFLQINFSDDGYYLERYHLAAAAFIKANLNPCEMLGLSPLQKAVLKKDFALCQLLLNHGASPNWRIDCSNEFPIFYAKSVDLIELTPPVGDGVAGAAPGVAGAGVGALGAS